jgi:Tol biopolymer transport system component
MSILFCRSEAGGATLNTIRPDGTGLRRLTEPSRPAGLAAWSPDGRQIAFASSSVQLGAAGVYVMNADGSDVRQLTSLIVDVNYAPAWSPDGQALAVAGFQYKSETGYDIWLIAADGSGMTNLTKSSEPEFMAAWAPDGGSLAVVRAARDGKTDLYLVRADGSASDRLTESDMPVGAFPSWSPDGASIAFYVQSGDDGSSGA